MDVKSVSNPLSGPKGVVEARERERERDGAGYAARRAHLALAWFGFLMAAACLAVADGMAAPLPARHWMGLDLGVTGR